MSYNSKYKGSEVEELLDSIDNKVDKVDGKQLSTEDFTTLLKQKLDGLSNYDDTEIQETVSKLRTDLDTLVSGDTTTAIKTFNEVIAFLDGLEDTEDLASIIASIEQQIAEKMDKVTLAAVATSGNYDDLSNKPSIPSAITESTVSEWGFTKNQGTITEVKMNGASKGTSGIVDLGNIITSHQDISGKKDKPNVQNVTTMSVSLVLTPNIIYNCTSALTDITISSFNTTSEGYEEYMVLFKSGSATTISLPSDVCLANGEQPEIDADTEYELSISKRAVDGTNIFKAILVPFKTIE